MVRYVGFRSTTALYGAHRGIGHYSMYTKEAITTPASTKTIVIVIRGIMLARFCSQSCVCFLCSNYMNHTAVECCLYWTYRLLILVSRGRQLACFRREIFHSAGISIQFSRISCAILLLYSFHRCPLYVFVVYELLLAKFQRIFLDCFRSISLNLRVLFPCCFDTKFVRFQDTRRSSFLSILYTCLLHILCKYILAHRNVSCVYCTQIEDKTSCT